MYSQVFLKVEDKQKRVRWRCDSGIIERYSIVDSEDRGMRPQSKECWRSLEAVKARKQILP